MNQSDEEEDFHSADEEGFGEEEQQTKQQQKQLQLQEGSEAHKSRGIKQEEGYIDRKEKKCNEKVINKERVDLETEQKSLIDDNNSSRDSVKIFREDSSLTTKHDSESNEPSIRESKDSCSKQDEDEAEEYGEGVVEEEDDEDEDEEEEALAERIRERNLKIARKFSAEIARNLRVSAPIPVKTPKSTSHEFPEIPDSIDRKSSFQPPAPPSTPALSSSFNNCSDPTAQTAGSSPSLNTQYGWRIPPKVATQQSSSGSSTPSKNIKADDQARQVLDRLTERLSQTDKNLFDRVAADIKKVSIKDEEVSAAAAAATTTTDMPSALTSITDLGSTLGGWGWSGATKLLSSASQVTSQVGSVLDSVVGVSAPNAAPSTSSSDAKNETGSAPNMPTDKTKSGDGQAERVVAGGEVTYNDPLVDLTLNAMESLGKKAFEVMTTRDETGSLQIKGLGRPWEHLLNTRKVDHGSSKDEVREEQVRRRSPSPPPESDQIETLDYSSASRIQSDSSSQSSSLKLRKRRQD